MVRAEFFALNKLELGYDRIDAMLYTGQLTGLGTEQGINANRMGIWCTLKVWRLEMSTSISSNYEGMISAYSAQQKYRLLSIKNAGVRSLMTSFLWFLFSYSLSTFFKRICFSRFVMDVTITVVELQTRFICLFFSYFWKKRGALFSQWTNIQIRDQQGLNRRSINTEM